MSVIIGDCLDVMPTLDANSVDAIVTDPPYGLTFMGKHWDRGVPGTDFWREAIRVAKPGAHLVAFGGTRTHHRLMCAIEDAGWEIRDTLGWLFGSGFPKSIDVSKAIDKANGDARPVIGSRATVPGVAFTQSAPASTGRHSIDVTSAASAASAAWVGWGTGLKPAWEPIILARKPLSGTVAANVLQHGTGALNIEGCRVQFASQEDKAAAAAAEQRSRQTGRLFDGWGMAAQALTAEAYAEQTSGRWPANILHDGSDEVVRLFPKTDSVANPNPNPNPNYKNAVYGRGMGGVVSPENQYTDRGCAARFFYTAKADQRDRNVGLEWREQRQQDDSRKAGNPGGDNPRNRGVHPRANHHPTVKPTELMRYLCRLITPPGGLILDPFCGSGSTGKAALLEGFRFLGIEMSEEYAEIARARIYAAAPLFAETAA